MFFCNNATILVAINKKMKKRFMIKYFLMYNNLKGLLRQLKCHHYIPNTGCLYF